MPFGLMNTLSIFQRMMDELLGYLRFVRVYLDDVVVFSKTLYAHLDHLRKVIDIVAKHGVKLKASTNFQEGRYLSLFTSSTRMEYE